MGSSRRRQLNAAALWSLKPVAHIPRYLSFLANGQVISISLPGDFVDQARRADRAIPAQDCNTASRAELAADHELQLERLQLRVPRCR